MDDPPTYSDLAERDKRQFYGIVSPGDEEGPSAPFLPPPKSSPRASPRRSAEPGPSPTFHRVPGFHGLPHSVKFVPGFSPDNNSDYGFDVRDSMDCLLVKGTVRPVSGNVSLQNVSGDQFLYIMAQNYGSGSSTNTYTVRVRGEQLTLGQITLFNKMNLKLTPASGMGSYAVHSVSEGDIAISRSIDNGAPMCIIHMNPSVTHTSFSGSMNFPGSSSSQPSEAEQCLCLSLAIVYMVAQNKEREVVEVQEAASEAGSQICGACLALLVIFLFCFGLWAILKIIASAECTKRYSARPGQKSKGCTAQGYPDWI